MRTIRPAELASDEPHGPWSCRGRDSWDAFCAAAEGDAVGLRALLARDPDLYRAEYWYTQPIHFAVREGQLETVRALLEAGADPGTTALSGDDLLTMARDRGHDAIVGLLEEERARRERTPPLEIPADQPLHAAAEQGDVERVRELLDADPGRIAETRASGRRTIARRRSPAPLAAACLTWSSCCCRAARPPVSQTTSPGRRRSPGPRGGGTATSPPCCEEPARRSEADGAYCRS